MLNSPLSSFQVMTMTKLSGQIISTKNPAYSTNDHHLRYLHHCIEDVKVDITGVLHDDRHQLLRLFFEVLHQNTNHASRLLHDYLGKPVSEPLQKKIVILGLQPLHVEIEALSVIFHPSYAGDVPVNAYGIVFRSALQNLESLAKSEHKPSSNPDDRLRFFNEASEEKTEHAARWAQELLRELDPKEQKISSAFCANSFKKNGA